MATAIVPKIYDPVLADENLPVNSEDAYCMVKRLASEEGLLVSPSGAAALVGCFLVAKMLPRSLHAGIVTGFPDSGDKYLCERFWDES
jgi:cysteine synthase B